MEVRITQIVAVEDGKSIYHESATTVTIVDGEAENDELITISQLTDGCTMTLRVYPSEWPTLREAINMMVSKCRG